MATTAKASRDCEEQGLWSLPAPTFGRQAWNPTRLNQIAPDPENLPTPLEKIGGLCLIEVDDRDIDIELQQLTDTEVAWALSVPSSGSDSDDSLPHPHMCV